MTAFQKIIRSKILIAGVAALILYSLSGFFMAPYLVTRFVPDMVAEKLNCELRMGAVKINPFLFIFQVDDVGLHKQDGAFIAGFRQCFIDLELSSLFRWALVFKSFRLDGPRINLIIDGEGVLNLSRLTPESPQSKELDSQLDSETVDTDATADAAGAAPLRLVLQHIQIIEGEIDFTDQRQSVPAMVAIRPLNIELNDISTLPDREGPYSLAATTGEQESFQWTGEITLHPFRSNGRLGFSNVKLSTVWQFARDSLAIDKPHGKFSIDSGYKIDLGQTEPFVRLNDLNFSLTESGLQVPGEELPLLELSRLDINVPLVDVTSKTVNIDTILFAKGRTAVTIDKNGLLNWSKLTPESEESHQPSALETPEPSAPKAPEKLELPWKVQVADLELRDIRFQYQDQSRFPFLHAGVTDIDGASQLSLSLGQAGTDLKVEDVTIGLNDIQIGNPETTEPEICIEKWRLKGGEYDLARNFLTINGIYFQGGDIDVLREKEGQLNLLGLFVPDSQEAETGKAETEPESTNNEVAKDPPGDTETSPFQFLIREMDFSNFGLSFSDQTVNPDGNIIHLDNLHVVASNIDGQSQMPIDMSFDIREGGRVEVQGQIDPAEPSVQTDFNVLSLSLIAFEPYLSSIASLQVASGAFSTQGQFAYRENETHPKLVYKGGIDVADLRILETGSEKTLLGWEHFMTSNLKFQLQPDRLEVADLKLSGLDGQFIIFNDGSLNLANAFKKDAGESTEAESTKEEPPAEEPKDAGEKGEAVFPVYIHKLRFEDGSMFFADYSLRSQFATKIHQLEGSIIGMSSERGARAQVQIDGRVNDYGMSKINGEINFFEPAAYTDMSVLFRNLEMTRLTPYSGKFVGRRIDSGKLSLDLKYFIENGKLKGDNQVIVEHIELGEEIDSPDAVSLPLNLAIAILEDANGVIDLGLPVSGDLEDPKFSYGQLIWKAFANLIKKLATAPFRALGALLGRESEKLDAILFENGSAELLPPEVEKLANLAKALEKRPNLRLVVQGRYSQESDGKALKSMQMRRNIAERQGVTLAPDEDPGILDFGNPDIQLVIEAAFTERFGTEALHEISTGAQTPAKGQDEAGASKEKVKIQDPVALWKKLYSKMVKDEPLEESVLVNLGGARAQAVLQELHGVRGFPLERVVLSDSKVLKPGKPVQAKLALEVL